MTTENISSDAVILLAHGTPNVLGEMNDYLRLVTGGRGVAPEVVRELQERYAQIGLTNRPAAEGAHLTKWTFRVADLLEKHLAQRVYVGMRNWHPLIRNVVDNMKNDGVSFATAICLAPQNSRTSVGLFRRALDTAVGNAFRVEFVAGWADHPLLVKAFVQRMRSALAKARLTTNGRTAALFTAHSVPTRTVRPSPTPVKHHGMILAAGPDSYEADCRVTAELVAECLYDVLSEGDHYFAFQSQGMTGGPWVGPSVEDTLKDLKGKGYSSVVIQPIGFLCDHVEILYDIDIVFQKTAHDLGLQLIRAESLNDSPYLIDAVVDLVSHERKQMSALAGEQAPLIATEGVQRW